MAMRARRTKSGKRKRAGKVPYGYRMVSVRTSEDSEWKNIDVALDSGNPGDGLTVLGENQFAVANQMLNHITQGAGSNNRIGRKVTLRRIHVRAIFTPTKIATVFPQGNQYISRLLVLLDTQTNGLTTDAASIFNTTNIVGKKTADTMTQGLVYMNLDNRGRYRVLHDEIVNAQAGGADASIPPKTFMKFSKKCQIPIEYSGSDASLSNIRSNNIIVVGCLMNRESNSGVTAVDIGSWTFTGIVRFRFSDS